MLNLLLPELLESLLIVADIESRQRHGIPLILLPIQDSREELVEYMWTVDPDGKDGHRFIDS